MILHDQEASGRVVAAQETVGAIQEAVEVQHAGGEEPGRQRADRGRAGSDQGQSLVDGQQADVEKRFDQWRCG